MGELLNPMSKIDKSILKRKGAAFFLESEQRLETIHLGFPGSDGFSVILDETSDLINVSRIE